MALAIALALAMSPVIWWAIGEARRQSQEAKNKR